MRDHYTLARLYVPQELRAGVQIKLLPSQAHFLGTVMRKNLGDVVRLFNGANGEWLGEISALSKRKAQVSITQCLRPPCPSPDIWLVFAPVKKARNSYIVEKATELGVSLMCPVITDRTTSTLKMTKMKTQIPKAAEQTERLDLPHIQNPVKLATLLEGWDENRILVFADEAGEALPAAHTLANVKLPCAVLIGPEGGFTSKEREMLREKPFVRPISLGPRILRADTAAVSVLAIWQAVSGDWT